MAPIVINEPTTLTWTPTEGSGTTVTMAVVLPDGTTLDPAPTVSGTTTFSATVTPTQAGRHLITWDRGGTGTLVDVLDVWPVNPRYLISVDDAIAAAGAGATLSQARRDEIQLYVAAASLVVEDIAGPVVQSSRSFTADGGGNAVVLPHMNVTVTSVTVGGTAIDSSAYVVNSLAGIVHYGQYGGATFTQGRQNVVVAYTTGDNVIDPRIRLAVIEQTKFLWQVQRQGATRDDLGYTPSGFAVPRMVEELARSASQSLPGFA